MYNLFCRNLTNKNLTHEKNSKVWDKPECDKIVFMLSATARNRNLNNGLISIYSVLITTCTLISNIKNGRENAKMKLVAILGLAELRMIVSASSFGSKTVV